MPYPQGRKRRFVYALVLLSSVTCHIQFLIPNSSFGITLNITHFHPILFHITHGSPLGLALNLSCGFPFARPRLSRCLTHTGVGISPIHVLVSHPYTQRGLTHRTFIFSFFHFSEALPFFHFFHFLVFSFFHFSEALPFFHFFISSFFHFSEAHFPPIRRPRRSFCVFRAFCVNYLEPPRLYKRTCHTENRRNIFPNTD